MAEARLEASMAASERAAAVPVLAYASAWILAMPSMPTPMMTSATSTSIRLKPPILRMRARVHRQVMPLLVWL